MCSSGYNPAQDTANNVIASAKRLIEVRQVCRSNNRIAEINVPAWPIPIHHTKLTISKPQPTGMLMPQMPTPVNRSLAIVAKSMQVSTNEIRRPTIQPFGCCFIRTIELILSVMLAKVYPGFITGCSSSDAGTAACTCSSLMISLLDSGFSNLPDTLFVASCSIRRLMRNGGHPREALLRGSLCH